ncbi:unnamed protein product [Owenia fusiformis]|uniref:Activator of Hsp90 ATPase AHSA1-like N-terminal domain-containing protein n=1 Tax=Owenia fusiformis TaxID=6347 RepID=A0A8S4PIT0_OWEFU|nr:unnamed protein product [Owenia fusiformis]
MVKKDEGCCEITEVSKIDGEASANNRKAKLIFFYEWEIKAEWSGKLTDGKSKFKGTMEIPNLSDENDPEDLDIQITTKSKNDDAYKLKEILRVNGTEKIQQQLGQYIKKLKEEYSQGMILPTAKDGEVVKPVNKTTNKNTVSQKASTSSILSKVDVGQLDIGVKIRTKTLKLKEEFKCQAVDLYRALTERERVQAFTRGPVENQAEPGANFTYFGGNVAGQFINVEPYKTIQQKWRFKHWPTGHYSEVTLSLEEKADCTQLNLEQTGIPEQDYEKTQEGWMKYYWLPIKQTFGYGASLF